MENERLSKTAEEWAEYFRELATRDRSLGGRNDWRIYIPLKYHQFDIEDGIRAFTENPEFVLSDENFERFAERMDARGYLWEDTAEAESETLSDLFSEEGN